MIIHTIFDVLAIIASVLSAWAFRKQFALAAPQALPTAHKDQYHLVLIIGMALGSFLFGSVNTWLADQGLFSKSLIGGIAGAILLAESYKKYHGIRGSTGLYYVPALCALIIVGRIGCYLAGIEDFTYGVVTALPWGVDFGDGLLRHPVQLYESFAMLLFLSVLWLSFSRYRQAWLHYGFYWFVLFYAGQRFLWEFIKPYPTLFLSFNVFHLVALALMLYALVMIRHAQKVNYA